MDYANKSETYYKNDRSEMLKFLPDSFNTVLDIGCGEGHFASIIKEQYNVETWGIEYMEDPGKVAEKILDKVFIGPCEDFVENLPDNYFDVIYCNDVLEHLVDPYWVLDKLRPKLSDKGVIISSIPNVRYHSVLKMLLFDKQWKYERSGVMDKTHMRFFTKKSIAEMYTASGYHIKTHKGINKTRSLKPYLYNLLFWFTASDMFYVQFATVASKSKP